MPSRSESVSSSTKTTSSSHVSHECALEEKEQSPLALSKPESSHFQALKDRSVPESQIHELWVEVDFPLPTSHIRNTCSASGDKEKVFCGYCGVTTLVTSECSVKAQARALFVSLAVEIMVAKYYEDISSIPGRLITHSWN